MTLRALSSPTPGSHLAGRQKAVCWQWLRREAWEQGQLDPRCSWYGQRVQAKWQLRDCKQSPAAWNKEKSYNENRLLGCGI